MSRWFGIPLSAGLCALVLAVGCGHSSSRSVVTTDDGLGTSDVTPTAPPEAPPILGFPDAPRPGPGDDPSGNGLGCTPATCETLGRNCGLVGDGCGGSLDCGTCGADAGCGLLQPNVCAAFSELCVPAAADVACAGKQCGIEGDGCGGTVSCGNCPDGESCGITQPFQCAPGTVSNAQTCPARITDCAEVGATCGVIGNGCGGVIDCGQCGSGELCGIESPFACGQAPTCQPLEPAVACANKCGLVSNGCGLDVGGGVIDCNQFFPCPDGQICGGGGIANQCGSGGLVCSPLDVGAACSGIACGAASDGCGGRHTCGDCGPGTVCRGGRCEEPQACVPLSPQQACDGKGCGLVGDGCGGSISCGTCAATQQCGSHVPFQCGVPEGASCVPQSPALACANKECGVVFDGCGTAASNRIDCSALRGRAGCPTGEACGLVSPFQCDRVPAPVCVPSASSCAALGFACGVAINNCGQTFDCAREGRSCGALETCIGGIAGPTQCVSATDDCPLCAAVPTCGSTPTRLRGRVVTPGRTDGDADNQVGVPNAFVYVMRTAATSALPAIETGIETGETSCDRCTAQDLGPVLASAITDSSGNYLLEGNLPVGQEFLLVTKAGKFRRAVAFALPTSAACATTDLPVSLPGNPTRLPRHSQDGLAVNLPRVAISTGRIDAMECVFEKLGIAHSEFGHFGSAARIHLYRGGQSAQSAAGARIDGSTPFDGALYTSLARLQTYDMVVADCEGADWDGEAEFAQRNASGGNVREYVNRGGRLFASHLSMSWLHENGATPYSPASPIATGLGAVGTWDTNYLLTSNLSTLGTGVVSLGRPLASPRINNFEAWMRQEGVLDANNRFPITDPRSLAVSLGSANEEFVVRTDGNGRVQQFSFNTPYGSPAAASCGRVAYSGFHVAATGGGDSPFVNAVFPDHCGGSLTGQEKVLLYMLFDLGTCVGGVPARPDCTPRACPSGGACGVIPDGCGGQLDCGCPSGQACVGTTCERTSCVPTTCAAEHAVCSTITDGCGGQLTCDCPLCEKLGRSEACATVSCGTVSDGCSGVYSCSECPEGCQPRRVCPPEFNCGLISDGCDGVLDCGSCAEGTLCGVRSPNVCSTPSCEPLTCAQANAQCGLIGDGCGGSLNCGDCRSGQVCTVVGGIGNQCAGCQPRTCSGVGAQCGSIGDGCGGTIDCGQCPEGTVCGAETPNQCGTGLTCAPLTCETAGASCGLVGDGCGGTVDCGQCPGGQVCGLTRAFQCDAPPPCLPRTCESAGAECGAIGDGCGGLLDCGLCPNGAVCGLAAPNSCVIIR